MIKVNYDSTTGEIKGFYPDDIGYANIPEPHIEIDETTHQDCVNHQGLRKVDVATGKINESVVKYCYTGYGLISKKVNGNYTTSTGEVLFSTMPTDAQLSAAFPTVASTRTFTVTTNASAGDKVTMFSTTITMGADVVIGSTIAETIVNLVAYMNEQERLLGNYRLTSSGDTFTLTERFAGGGLDIPEPTIVGDMKVSSGVLTESVWGYTTQVKHEKKLALEEQAEVVREEYRKNYIGAVASGDTTLAQSILTDISTLNTNLYNAMGVINDE